VGVLAPDVLVTTNRSVQGCDIYESITNYDDKPLWGLQDVQNVSQESPLILDKTTSL
jgi:hypothetical protein